MNNICLKINESIKPLNALVKTYGLCELVIKGNQRHPITVTDRKQVVPDDRQNVVVYHRLISADSEEDEDNSFGSKKSKRYKARLRTVVFQKVLLGENFIYDLANSLPDRLVIEGYKFVHLSENINIVVDHEGIYDAELNGSDYERHRTSYNLYALEYDVEFIKC